MRRCNKHMQLSTLYGKGARQREGIKQIKRLCPLSVLRGCIKERGAC
jgi:hypothetical protein